MFQDASQPWAPAVGVIDAGSPSAPDGEPRTVKPSTQSQNGATVRAPYPLPAELPTQIGPKGIRFGAPGSLYQQRPPHLLAVSGFWHPRGQLVSRLFRMDVRHATVPGLLE